MNTDNPLGTFIRADLYRILGWCFSPPEEGTLEKVQIIAAELIDSPYLENRWRHLLQSVLSALSEMDTAALQRDYSRLFLKGSVPLSESAYHLNLDVIPRVSTFYSLLGIAPKSGETPDSLPYELEFAALLLLKQALAQNPADREVMEQIYRKFVGEHLAGFCEGFITKLSECQPSPFYERVRKLLEEFVQSEVPLQKV